MRFRAQAVALLQVDVVFMSPPWGGVEYYKKDSAFEVAGPDCFGLGASLAQLLAAAQQALRGGKGCIAVFLPRNTPLQQARPSP